MYDITINGFDKIKGLKISDDWICSMVMGNADIYVMTFDYTGGMLSILGDMFYIVTIYRKSNSGHKITADVSTGVGTDQHTVNNIYVGEIYPHDLITLDKFKELLLSKILIIRQ